MSLFDVEVANPQVGYANIKAAQHPDEALIKSALEELWSSYEPYADSNFKTEFALQPDVRFWEMYLTYFLLQRRRNMVRRDELPKAQRNEGPDICIPKRNRKIWIEVIAPDQGAPNNLDHVPDLEPASPDGQVQDARRQVELRISSALLTKRDAFEEYRQKGLIAEKDSCVIAISGGLFALQAIEHDLPHALTTVYPFGEERFALDPDGPRIISLGHTHSPLIERRAKPKDPIRRSAFLHPHFKGVSGIIWSRRSIGNFLGQSDDFIYIHNHGAERPIPRRWYRWRSEYFPDSEGAKLTVIKRRGRN